MINGYRAEQEEAKSSALEDFEGCLAALKDASQLDYLQHINEVSTTGKSWNRRISISRRIGVGEGSCCGLRA